MLKFFKKYLFLVSSGPVIIPIMIIVIPAVIALMATVLTYFEFSPWYAGGLIIAGVVIGVINLILRKIFITHVHSLEPAPVWLLNVDDDGQVTMKKHFLKSDKVYLVILPYRHHGIFYQEFDITAPDGETELKVRLTCYLSEDGCKDEPFECGFVPEELYAYLTSIDEKDRPSHIVISEIIETLFENEISSDSGISRALELFKSTGLLSELREVQKAFDDADFLTDFPSFKNITGVSGVVSINGKNHVDINIY